MPVPLAVLLDRLDEPLGLAARRVLDPHGNVGVLGACGNDLKLVRLREAVEPVCRVVWTAAGRLFDVILAGSCPEERTGNPGREMALDFELDRAADLGESLELWMPCQIKVRGQVMVKIDVDSRLPRWASRQSPY